MLRAGQFFGAWPFVGADPAMGTCQRGCQVRIYFAVGVLGSQERAVRL